MRISDWSSDVCSSDLPARPAEAAGRQPALGLRHHRGRLPGLEQPHLRLPLTAAAACVLQQHRIVREYIRQHPRRSRSMRSSLSAGIRCEQNEGPAPERGPFFDTTAVRSALGELEAPARLGAAVLLALHRSEEHTSELQSLMRNSYAVFCLKKK